MGLRAIKFRIKDDVLVGLKVLGEGEELLLSLKGVMQEQMQIRFLSNQELPRESNYKD